MYYKNHTLSDFKIQVKYNKAKLENVHIKKKIHLKYFTNSYPLKILNCNEIQIIIAH